MSRYWNTTYYEQPNTKELKKNAAESRKKEAKKGNVLEPVTAQGRNIAKNWWGKTWCSNLERYADYRISPLSEEKCQSIIQKCGRKIENMEALLNGNFPEEMQELFQGKDGLFPAPREISFNCSCPDWALMCKHVAAALYGVGVRLDEQPLLFFELRGIDVGHFIDVTLANKVEAMLANEGKASDRIIEDKRIWELFGVL